MYQIFNKLIKIPRNQVNEIYINGKNILGMFNIRMGMFNTSFFFQSTVVFCTEIKSVQQEGLLQEWHAWRHDKMKVLHVVG
jgi:hypothetical protein